MTNAHLAAPDHAPGRSATAAVVAPTGHCGGVELVAKVVGTAWRLRGLGVRAGDRVLLSGDNSVEYVVTALALAHLDTSLVLADHRLPPAAYRRFADRAGVRWFLHEVDDGIEVPGPRTVRYPDLLDELPAGPGPRSSLGTLDRWWRRPDAVILHSSGTTGSAKGVVKSGSALLDNTLRTWRVMGYRRWDVLAPWLPFSHQYGMSMLLLWWLCGATLVVTPYRQPHRAVEDAVRHRATVVDAPPSTYLTLLRLVDRRPDLPERLSHVRMWGVGGAPLPGPLREAFAARLGRPLLDGYGLTEVGNVALATPDNPVGCGRPIPGVGVRVTGEGRRPLAPGEHGEIEVRSAGAMTGYLRADRTVARHPAGSWYRTNDLGYLDQSGNLHVLGRHRAVHRLGHTLYPESIERRAESCGRPLKVVAVDDERRGSSLVFVVCDPDGGDPREWRRRLCALLPEYEHPNRVLVLEEFPLTANGKVDVDQLRARVVGARPMEGTTT